MSKFNHMTGALRELFLLEESDIDYVIDMYKQSLDKIGLRPAMQAVCRANPNLVWDDIAKILTTLRGDPHQFENISADTEADTIVPKHEDYMFTVEEWVLAQGITAHIDIINFGKSVAQTYRRTRTVDPDQAVRNINNLDIKVNVYRAADVSLIQAVATRYMPKEWVRRYGSLFEKSSVQTDSLQD